MSKGQGRQIAIKFTQPLIDTVVTPEGGYPEQKNPTGEWTANATYSSSYPLANLFDESTSTYWRTNSKGSYIQLECAKPTVLHAIRWYSGTSYYMTKGLLSASNDGINFVTIATVTYGTTYWNRLDFTNYKPYKYYRLYLNDFSSYCYLYELEFYYKSYVNERAFVLTGKRYKYIGGPIIDEEYVVDKIENHPTEQNAILLTVLDESRFNNIYGDILVSYSSSFGNLKGSGGNIVSFSIPFIPIDLVPVPNPYSEQGSIRSISKNPIASITKVTRNIGYESENISIGRSINVGLTYVGVINP